MSANVLIIVFLSNPFLQASSVQVGPTVRMRKDPGGNPAKLVVELRPADRGCHGWEELDAGGIYVVGSSTPLLLLATRAQILGWHFIVFFSIFDG